MLGQYLTQIKQKLLEFQCRFKGDTGLAGAAQNAINQATDVDVTSFPLQDGSLLQYRASTGKWTARNELDTTTGNLVLSGGSF